MVSTLGNAPRSKEYTVALGTPEMSEKALRVRLASMRCDLSKNASWLKFSVTKYQSTQKNEPPESADLGRAAPGVRTGSLRGPHARL